MKNEKEPVLEEIRLEFLVFFFLKTTNPIINNMIKTKNPTTHPTIIPTKFKSKTKLSKQKNFCKKNYNNYLEEARLFDHLILN